MAVNAIANSELSEQKAYELVSKAYKDYEQLPAWFLMGAAKANVLDMVVVMPGKKVKWKLTDLQTGLKSQNYFTE